MPNNFSIIPSGSVRRNIVCVREKKIHTEFIFFPTCIVFQQFNFFQSRFHFHSLLRTEQVLGESKFIARTLLFYKLRIFQKPLNIKQRMKNCLLIVSIQVVNLLLQNTQITKLFHPLFQRLSFVKILPFKIIKQLLSFLEVHLKPIQRLA